MQVCVTETTDWLISLETTNRLFWNFQSHQTSSSADFHWIFDQTSSKLDTDGGKNAGKHEEKQKSEHLHFHPTDDRKLQNSMDLVVRLLGQ